MQRRTLLTATAVGLTATAVGVVPAVAAPAGHKPTTRPTSITLKATRGTVAPKHKTTLTATLKSGHKRLSGETLYLEQRAARSHTWSDPTALGSPTDDNGSVTVPVTPGNHKGHKEQYRVVFQGDSGYKASHSAVITVTVS